MQIVQLWRDGVEGCPDPSTGTSSKMAPRLRDFHPALVGYALTGQIENMLEAVAVIDDLHTPNGASDLTGE